MTIRTRRARERHATRQRADVATRAALLLAVELERGSLSVADYQALYAWCITPEIDAVAAELRA